jgi:UDP-glucose 4-epimerase
MAAILITGGCGFLGWNIARDVTRSGDRAVCLDMRNPDSRLMHWKNDRIKIIEGDVTDYEKVLGIIRAENIEKIVHGGALLGYTSRADEIRQFIKTNVEGTLNILEAMRVSGVGRAVYLSSEEVYGTFRGRTADETHPMNPVGIYGITKQTAELLIDMYHAEHHVDCLILRTCWVYGPGLPRDRAPWFLIENAVKGVRGFIVNGGDHSADKTYVDDLVQGVRLALSKEKVGSRIFNIASGQSSTLSQMVDAIKKIMPGAPIDVGPGLLDNSDNVKLPQKGALDIGRAARELGYRPEYDLEKGLRKYMKWLSDTSC